MHRAFPRRLSVVAFLLSSLVFDDPSFAQAQAFPMPAGLEKAVEFWKQIFTRYSFAEVVLFDPVDPTTIYSVVRAPESEEGRERVVRAKISGIDE